MTDKEASIFQGGDLEIDNPQSREEDEDLEEQRRRQEELTDLLAAGIGAFTYDESTIEDSSTVSSEAPEESYRQSDVNGLQFKYNDPANKMLSFDKPVTDSALEQNYKDARPQDQLQLLYEIQVREINALREEFEIYKAEKEKEISGLRSKLTLSEAEIRHLQLSNTNLEELLVEKTDIINNLKENVVTKDQEIENMKRNIEQLNREICSYSTAISELQLKLADNNPFGNRGKSAGEVQKSHLDQVLKLETLLQENTKKVEILEKENIHLKEDIRKLAKDKNQTDDENNETIMALSRKLQACQQQCKDLFLLGEAIKKESDHFKERMIQVESNTLDLSNDSFKTKSMDKDTMAVHLEKLKRMLLDREVELNTLKAKLKFYDSDLEELFRYRNLLNNLYNCEIKLCGNPEHGELLLFMQRQLQTYEQAVADRNQQIENLNTVNRELQGKIEEMIQQTRTDIQNLSQKYSLPQLETMSNELKNAEIRIKELESELQKQSEKEKVLLSKLEKALQENDYMQRLSKNEKKNFDEMLEQLKGDLKKSETEIRSLKEVVDELKSENDRVKSDIVKQQSDSPDNSKDDDKLVKTQYAQVQDQLHQVAKKLESMNKEQTLNDAVKFITMLKKKLERVLSGIENTNVVVKKEQFLEILSEWHNSLIKFLEASDNLNSSSLFNFNASKESEYNLNEIVNTKTILEAEKLALEECVENLKKEHEKNKNEFKLLQEKYNVLLVDSEANSNLARKLKEELDQYKENYNGIEQIKNSLETELERTKQQNIHLQKQMGEMSESLIRKSLFKEIKDVENLLERSRSENDISGTDIFQKCLQAEMLKAELLLRDKLQEESMKKINQIEEQYKKIITEKTDSFNKEKNKWRSIEASCKKQFAAVLEECSKKMLELENENLKLLQQTETIVMEYQEYKRRVFVAIGNYQKMIVDCKNEHNNLKQKWEALLQFSINNYSLLTKQSIRKKNAILKKINSSQTKIDLIQKAYDEKIRKFKENSMIPTKD